MRGTSVYREVVEARAQADVVVLGSDSVGRSEVEAALCVVEFERDVSAAESDVDRSRDMSIYATNVLSLEIRWIPKHDESGMQRRSI